MSLLLSPTPKYWHFIVTFIIRNAEVSSEILKCQFQKF
jgi:hypothetical protein